MMLPSRFWSASTRATCPASAAFRSGVRYTRATLVVLRGAGLEAKRPGLEIHLQLGLRPV
jgi:hypothetical protein